MLFRSTTVPQFLVTASWICRCSSPWPVYPFLTIAFTLDIQPGTSALVTYEYISTFQEEVELYWRQKFRISTAVFLANRYLGLIFFGFLEYIPLRPDLLVCVLVAMSLYSSAYYRRRGTEQTIMSLYAPLTPPPVQL